MADPLEQNLIRIWNQLITERRLKLRSSLSEYAALTSGVLTYGSLCSGTLIEGIALPAILQMVQKKTAVHLEPRLAFACENVAWKRALLQDDERGIKVPVFTCVHEMARSPECVTDSTGKTWIVFHGWERGHAGYANGGERTVRFYPLDVLPPRK